MSKKAKPKKKKTPPTQTPSDLMETIREFDRSPPEKFTPELQPTTENEKNTYEPSN